MNENTLSPEAQELLRLMKAHTTESLQCVYRRIDDVAHEQTHQRKLQERSISSNAAMHERSEGHEKRLDKVEKTQETTNRKVYALSGATGLVVAALHYFKGH